MKLYDVEKYGAHLSASTGWIAVPGEEVYNHRFGGDSWKVLGTHDDCDAPTLLLTFDLRDAKLDRLGISTLSELPLCSYLNCDAWAGKQFFQILPDAKTVTLLNAENSSPSLLSEEDRLPNPLPESRIKLRAMSREDYPIDEEAYWDACDKFVGGNAFIRVLGPPIWLQWVEQEVCKCGARMQYVSSVGYEAYDQPGGVIPDKPFFIGEVALYFFLCLNCLTTAVISQAT
jgi:hypothetical protein